MQITHIINKTPPKTPSNPVLSSIPTKKHYLDVAINDLNPKYDSTRVCLYGDYYVGEENVGFESFVWVSPVPDLVDYLTSQYPGTKDIGCGIVKYFPKGTGHMGIYQYQLSAEIITEEKNETPYPEKINIPEDCSKIPGINRRGICYWDFAIMDKNVELCKLIGDNKIRNSCLLHLANDLSQSNVCQGITSDEKTGINLSLFFKNSWLPISTSIKEVCYAISGSEIKDCNNVSEQNLKERCLARVAFQVDNADVCGKIQDSTSKKFCYADLAIKLNDLSICEKLPEGQVMYPDGSGEYVSEQSECYWAYVARTKNYKICDRIKEEGNRTSCQAIK